LILKSGWVRPEDVSEYESMGIDIFKIAGRTDPINWILNVMRAYKGRSFDGNLLDILDVTRELRDLFYISNKKLDGAIEKWKECQKECYKCKFCESLAKEIIKVYSYKGTEKEKMIDLKTLVV
jgi:collagenase-like PrtC family protease